MRLAAAGSVKPRDGWLFGPGIDLVLGCGLGSIAVSVAMGFQSTEIALWVPGALLVLLFSLPHYGATLLRVYELPEDRRRYSVFAVGATTLLALAFIGSLGDVLVGSIVLTVYLTWSPWHYTGQNYGVFLILLGRRGVGVAPGVKRWIYASFLLSYLLTFMAIHGLDRPDVYAPVSYAGTVYRLLPLGIPASLSVPVFWGLAAAYVVALGVGLGSLWRSSSLSQVAPSLVVVATQSLWFVVPVVARYAVGPRAVPGLSGIYDAYGFLWIAAAHAVQYLWVTAYFARRSGRAASYSFYFAKTAFAGFAIWTLPVLIFAPGVLGNLPHEAGLAVLVAAVVNIHHFILDGVIWKLRDGRIARVLLRKTSEPLSDPESSAPPRRWVAGVAGAVGAACIGVGLLALWEEEAFRRAMVSGDLPRARAAVERLDWIGREGPRRQVGLARLYASRGQIDAAAALVRRSLDLHPTPEAWRSLGLIAEQAAEWTVAESAYDGLLAMLPDDGPGLYRRGLARLEAGDAQGALVDLKRASELHPEMKLIGLSRRRAERQLERQKHAEPTAPGGVGSRDFGE
ncbi:MAG: hypothetical protein VX574_00995 [Myxococcota bacterium]|nr:hypothetical protein [Myxococcota bacterium]